MSEERARKALSICTAILAILLCVAIYFSHVNDTVPHG